MSFEPCRYCPYCDSRKYVVGFVGKRCADCQAVARREKEERYHARWPGKQKETSRSYYTRYPAVMLMRNARRRAKKNGVPFDLEDHMPALQERLDGGVCEMTGLPFNLDNADGFWWDSPSIDRIKPELGYVYSNIRLVLYGMNAGMNRWGEDVLEKMVRAWLARK